ncbi:hypothetical protein HanIR_Chr13g0619231 [Helianthus annuus]|nr:hypothetical protein HanIR_Chr13g0619231 [Helianthus annuus]
MDSRIRHHRTRRMWLVFSLKSNRSTVLGYILKLVDAPPALRGESRIILNQLKKDYYNFPKEKKNKNDDKTVVNQLKQKTFIVLVKKN